MRNKKIKILVLLLVVILMIAGGIFLYQQSQPPPTGAPGVSRAEIENILMLSKATFGYPKMMDENARADDARITDKNEFEVMMTLMNIDTTHPTYLAELEKMKTTLPRSACEKRPLRFLLYKGITVLLTFRSNDKADLFQYKITPEMCGE